MENRKKFISDAEAILYSVSEALRLTRRSFQLFHAFFIKRLSIVFPPFSKREESHRDEIFLRFFSFSFFLKLLKIIITIYYCAIFDITL